MQVSGFIGPAYKSQNPSATAEVCINWYPEKNETPGAKVPFVLCPVPGVRAFATLTAGPGRGIFSKDGRCFAIGGDALNEIRADGSVVNRAQLVNDFRPVQFASSGDAGGELLATSARFAYVVNLTTHVSAVAVSEVDFIGYVDGFFVALDAETSTFKRSAALDGTTWSSTIQRDTAGDRWVSMLVANRDVWLIGSETTDIYQNTGASPEPFTPIGGGSLQVGTGAPYSAALLRGSPVWLTQTKTVIRMQGYGAPQRISHHALEQAIRGYGVIADAEGCSYEMDGHAFYELTFPTARATWVYDDTTGSWAERPFWNTQSARYEASRHRGYALAFGKHLVCDRTTATVYEVTPQSFVDVDSQPIRRVRRALLFGDCVAEVATSDPVAFHLTALTMKTTPGSDFVFLDELELEMAKGVGLTSGQGSDPQIMLRLSNDSGLTFGNELMRAVGQLGKFQTRVRWHRLGRYRAVS